MSALSCDNVPFLARTDQCAFVKSECHGDGFINSFRVYYCLSSNQSIRSWIGMPVLIVLLVVMFMCMGLVASEGLVPNLNSVSRWCRIPQGLAGLTLMAFANGSPDIVSTYASIKSGNASLALGELVGAALFINCVVIGVVFILHPFDIIEPNVEIRNITADDQQESDLLVINAKAMYLRDVSFFGCAMVVLLYTLSDNILTRKEMLVMVSIYVAYVLTIMVWQWVVDKKVSKIRINNRIRNMFNDDNPLSIPIDDNVELEDSYGFNPLLFKTLELGTIMDSLNRERRLKLILSNMPIIREIDGADDLAISHDDIPIELDLPSASIVEKFVYYITAPFITFFRYTIPILNYNKFEGDFKPGLARLTQMVSSLMIGPFIVLHTFVPNLSWPLKLIFVVPILCSSYAAYHNLVKSSNPSIFAKFGISLLGFLTSVSFIAIFASQVIDTLMLFSSLTLLRPSLLGLTIFAVGNSMGDLISCVVIARMGYPLMALGSCIGGPLLNLLLGLGISGLVSGATDISVVMGGSVAIGGSALLLNLVLIFMIMIPVCGWKASSQMGWVLISVWCFVIALVFIIEFLLTY